MQSRILSVLVVVLTVIATAAVTLLATKGEAPASGSAAAPSTVSSGGAIDQKTLEKAIADYITNNPETVINALMAGRAKQEQAEAANAEKTIGQKKDELEKSPGSPTFAAKDGDVTVVMFSDYNCGFCKRATPQLDELVKADPKVRIVIKEFPILGDLSVLLAKAGIGFYKLNPEKYYDFHEALMKSTPRSEEQLYGMAEQFGVKPDALKAEMAKPETQKEIEANVQLGTSIGVRGTPAFIIGGQFIRGAVDATTMKDTVSKIRSGAKAG